MAIDAQKALQLSALLAMTSQQFAVDNPGQQQLAQGLLGSAQAGIQAEALKKAKKEQEKKEKGAFGSKIGSLIGAAALSAIPGVGPVAAAGLGALGGAAGGAIGSGIAGGGYSGSQALTDGIMGGMNAYQYGKSSQFAQPDNAAAERPMTETLGKQAIPPVTTLGPNPVGMFPTSPKNAFAARQETPVLPNGAPAIPVTSGVHPSTNNAMNAAQKPVGFGQRLMGGIAQGLGIEQQRRVVRNPDGTVDLY